MSDTNGVAAASPGRGGDPPGGMGGLEIEPHHEESGDEYGDEDVPLVAQSTRRQQRKNKLRQAANGTLKLPPTSTKTPETGPVWFTWTKLFKIGGGLGFLVALVLLGGLFLIVDEEEVVLEGDEGTGTVVVKKEPTKHTSDTSFGGIHNIAHPGGVKAAAKGEGIHDLMKLMKDRLPTTKPVSAEGSVSSLNILNLLNLWGHYVHDEHRSPYASHLYDKPRDVLENEQTSYEQKMKQVRAQWGAWEMLDPAGKDYARTVTNFDDWPYKDAPRDEFAPDAWQSDVEYLQEFWKQGRALVTRMQEGIYAEYGCPLTKPDGTNLTTEELEARDKKWKIYTTYNTQKEADAQGSGVARLSKAGFRHLVRKLLHAMMTHDEFYVVLGGHSAAAGHGNDFIQNKYMTFHHIMEPVMNKLGVKLITRNMGMGGVGTLHFSLAGKDLYGEADLMEWDSGMTEKGPSVDFWNKVQILSGQRVPLILTPYHFNIPEESNYTAPMGLILNDNSMVPETTLENQDSMPFAARWLNGHNEKYNAICWEPRTDITPKLVQQDHPGSQVSWHPGFRAHQFSGRKVAMIVLKALQEAFDVWEDGVLAEGAPLNTTYWHMGPQYSSIRSTLKATIDKPDATSDCQKMFSWLPRICKTPMHGFGMWYPRAHTDYDMLKIIKPAPNGWIPHFDPAKVNIYDGFDILPYAQKIPDGHIDVHAIAIATTTPPPDIDHSWIEIEDAIEDTNNPNATNTTTTTTPPPPTRRWLQKATKSAIRQTNEFIHSINNRPSETTATTTKTSSTMSMSSRSSSSSTTTTTRAAHTRRSSDSRIGRRHRRQLNETNTTTPAADDTSTETAEVAAKPTGTGIVPGRGWETFGAGGYLGNCDGSINSECCRTQDNQCLVYGANDRHNAVHGNSLSGWLVLNVPNVREGIILARMEWWCGGTDRNKLTKGWTEVNNGQTDDTTPWNLTEPWNRTGRHLMASFADDEEEHFQSNSDVGMEYPSSSSLSQSQDHRFLKPTPDDLVPKDFEMDISIDGEITTMKREEWIKYIGEASKNCAAWPLLNDESGKYSTGEPVEVAIRFRSETKPTQTWCISHIYYA